MKFQIGQALKPILLQIALAKSQTDVYQQCPFAQWVPARFAACWLNFLRRQKIQPSQDQQFITNVREVKSGRLRSSHPITNVRKSGRLRFSHLFITNVQKSGRLRSSHQLITNVRKSGRLRASHQFITNVQVREIEVITSIHHKCADVREAEVLTSICHKHAQVREAEIIA